MKILAHEKLVMVDVDDTLVMHSVRPAGLKITLVDPYDGRSVILEINENMVRLVKEEHKRGSTIVVWSRGGYQWANEVVIALGLEDVVSLVMSKPLVYFDDKPVTDWLTDRVYIGPNTPYKKQYV